MNLSTCTSAGSLSSGLNLGRSLSECLGKGCCTPGTATVVVLSQGSCGLGGLGGGLPLPLQVCFLPLDFFQNLKNFLSWKVLGYQVVIQEEKVADQNRLLQLVF